MGLPIVHIEFKKLAETMATRTASGTAAVVVLDSHNTASTPVITFYNELSQIDASEYTAANYKAIARAFTAKPLKVVVIKLKNDAVASDIAGAIDRVAFDWICTNAATTHQTALANAVKAMNASSRRIRKVKAVVTGVSNADDMHVVNVANTNVTIKGESSTTTTADYLPRICGLLAACPITESATYKPLEELEKTTEPSNIDTTIDGGNLVLFNDDDVVRIARGINTLQTIGGNVTEDMKSIAIVEVMDTMQKDIVTVFKNNYLGKVRNSADNQNLFLSDVVIYFNSLATAGIVDTTEGSPFASIDVVGMRDAWTAAGVDVSDLTDDQIRKKTYRSNVFIDAACRIFDAMEDIKMKVMLG